MIFKKKFYIWLYFFINININIYAPSTEWDEITPKETISTDTPAYQILMEREKQAKQNSIQKLKRWIFGENIHTDPTAKFVQFDKPRTSLIPSEKFNEGWDIIDADPNPEKKALAHNQALQTIKAATEYYQDIADGEKLPNATDEKIFNNFLLRPELFKSFITDPHNTLFPQNLHTEIQEILKNPNDNTEYTKLQSALLAAKKKFMDEKNQKLLIEQEEETRKKLNSNKEFQDQLKKIHQQQSQEHQAIQRATEHKEESLQRSALEASQQAERTTLTEEFNKIFNTLQKHTQQERNKADQIITTNSETDERTKIAEEEEQEHEQLKQKNIETILEEQQHQAFLQKQKDLKLQEAHQRRKAIEEMHQRHKAELEAGLLLSKPEREKLKNERYLEQLGEVQSIKSATMADYQNLITTDLSYNKAMIDSTFVNEYIKKVCKPFQDAIDSPTLPQEKRAIHFLKTIPKIALKNGATLRKYLSTNNVNIILNDLLYRSSDDQAAILDNLAIKIKQYKKEYEKIEPVQYKASHDAYKKSIAMQ
ncbi:hypothetical protein KAZ82_00400 [Candidatus Babeliales bacterium]|nr:hypothetical protein [Candidatus Babeliales bacterium]